MTLAFSTKFPKGKGTLTERPTFFVEKVWESILQNGVEINANDFIEYGRKSLPKHYTVGTNKPKLHTIRKDSKTRWKAGNKIHPVINNRTPQRFQFAPTLDCVSIQNVEIRYDYPNNPEILPYVFIDNELLDTKEIHELAINDGFDSTHDFFEWFNEDFKGKIIHWTNHKY